MIKLVLYESQFTNISEAKFEDFETWEQVVELIRVPEVHSHKGAATQIFYGSYREDATGKGDSSVDQIYCLVIDADSLPAEDLSLIESRIVENGWKAVLHSSFRHNEYMQHDPPIARIRVILPLSRPVRAAEYPLLWSNANLIFEGYADPTTRSPSKHYLVPSHPPGEEEEAAFIFKEFSGVELDPDELMRRFGSTTLAEAEVELFELGSEKVSANMLKSMLEAKYSKEERPFVDAIKRALGKLEYAEEGFREKTLFGMAGIFAKAFPRGNPDDICEAIEYSVEYVAKRGGPSLVDFRDKLIRRQRDYLRRSAEKRFKLAEEQATIARLRDTKEQYTEANLKPYFEQCNNRITFEDLKRALVLVHHNNFYVFGDNKYHRATSTSILAVIRDFLLYRAEDHLGFSYYYPSEGDKPPTPKIPDHFVRDHGMSVDQVRYTHRGISFFDVSTRILWISETLDVKRIVPERCIAFEEWAKCLCGEDALYQRFCQWLSQVPDTRQALAGLVIMGQTGIGKSAFAEGISKLWGHSPGSMQNAMSGFNSEMVLNPVVFADESLPEINGKVPTDKLRSLISSGKHEINRKGQPVATLDSFVRVIMALQDMTKFDFGKGHTREDIEAIGKRFLFIQGAKKASELFDYELFVNQNGIAKHVMWLAQNMQRTSQRFGVETEGTDFVITADPYTMQAADWIVYYLRAKVYKSAEAGVPNKKISAFVNNGDIYVNGPMMRKEWEQYQEGRAKKYVPSAQELTQALRALSYEPEPIRIRMAAGQETYWRIKKNIVRQRAVQIGELSEEQFDLLLSIPHELHFKSSKFKLSEEDKKVRIESLKAYREYEGSIAS